MSLRIDFRRLILPLLAALVLAGCGGDRIVVASKNFTEQVILGEILAQHIENRLGVEVDRKLNLGGTLVAHQALLSGSIDLYPEYTGTALMAILDQPPGSDPDSVFETVSRDYRNDFQAEWLPPLGFNDTFAMVIPGKIARENQLETVSDATRYPPGWTLGVGYEFEGRPDGLPALERGYGLKWDGAPKTMDLGLIYAALEDGQVTMISANSTDGMLSKLDVKVLEDDKHVFPPYQAAVVAREDTLSKYPGLREVLLELSGTVDQKTMQQMNYQVDGEHRTVEDVAAEFLATLPAPQ